MILEDIFHPLSSPVEYKIAYPVVWLVTLFIVNITELFGQIGVIAITSPFWGLAAFTVQFRTLSLPTSHTLFRPFAV